MADDAKTTETKEMDVPAVSKDDKMDAKPMTDAPKEKGEYKSDGGYKKGGVMKWVVIYLIVAAVVYGAYYFYARPQNNSASGTSTTGY